MTKEQCRKLLYDTCLDHGVDDVLQIAYILATAGIESVYGSKMYELYNGDPGEYFEGKYGSHTKVGKRLGNINPGDGFKFRGRGFVQITGRDNYIRFSRVLGIDIVYDPDLVTKPKIAGKIIVLGMRDGLFTGKKVGDYLSTDRSICDLEGARKIVNPGEGTRRIADFEREFFSNINWINGRD